MNKQKIVINPQFNKWPSWFILLLRWLLGAIAGVGISSWIYFALKNDIGPILSILEIFSILFLPFGGHLYIFYPGATSYSHLNDFLFTFPVLFWGSIGALLASGRKSQRKIGIFLLLLFMAIGYLSFFLGALRIPT